MRIALDVGHARESGARGGGAEEHAVAEAVAGELAPLLRARGHEVDVIDYPHLSNRCDLVRTRSAIEAGDYDISVSLHCDASDREDACGAHVCYVSTAGLELARCIARPLCSGMPGRADIVQRRTDLYILKAAGVISVLVEMGFITHAGDRAVLLCRAGCLAQWIADGIGGYAALRGKR